MMKKKDILRKEKAEQSKPGSLTNQRLMRKKIKKLTFGVTDALTNVALYLLYVTLEMPGGGGPAKVHRAFDKADTLISEFNAKQFRKAVYNLRQQGLITSLTRAVKLPKITEAGMKRIKATFPFYDEERVWDKKLYLIVYDIPTEQNRKRDLLRGILEELKAVMLQESVYLTCYNPEEIIKYISEEEKIKGRILVSTLDPQGSLGNVADIKEYLWEVYGLEQINNDYANFISHYKNLTPMQAQRSRSEIIFAYLSVLRRDPQIPFELLQDEYLGDEAYLLFRKLLGGKS